MPFPCGFGCCLTLWPNIFRGQAAHGWKQAVTPLAVFPLVWISSELMCPQASLHCKQWAAKERDSSLLMLLNRIHHSDGLIELGLLQTHTHGGASTYINTQLRWWEPVEACCACWGPKRVGNGNWSLESVVHYGTCGNKAPVQRAD